MNESEIIVQLLNSPVIQGMAKHIAVLNEDYTALSVSVAVLESQMREVLYIIKAVALGLIAFLGMQVWQIIIMRRNGKK